MEGNRCVICRNLIRGSGQKASKFSLFLKNIFGIEPEDKDKVCDPCRWRISKNKEKAYHQKHWGKIRDLFSRPEVSPDRSPKSIPARTESDGASPSAPVPMEHESPEMSPTIVHVECEPGSSAQLPGASTSTPLPTTSGAKPGPEVSPDRSPKSIPARTESDGASPSAPVPMEHESPEMSPTIVHVECEPGSSAQLPGASTSTPLPTTSGAKPDHDASAVVSPPATYSTLEPVQPSTSSYQPAAKRKLVVDEETEGPMEKRTLQGEYNSIPIDQFEQTALAQMLACAICQGVPREAVLLQTCNHIYCKNCIRSWMTLRCTCPTCRKAIEEDDIASLTGPLLLFYESLTVKCDNHSFGCGEILNITSLNSHVQICKLTRTRRGKSERKAPLQDMSLTYIRNRRLPNIIKSVENEVESFCVNSYEDKTDVYFALLVNYLDKQGDKKRVEDVLKVWKHQTLEVTKLSHKQCLALRVDTLQSKAQYKKQFDFMHQQLGDQNPYQTPHSVTHQEHQYMPGSVRYQVEGQEFVDSFYHTPAKIPPPGKRAGFATEPVDIMADHPSSTPEIPAPNVAGVRWPYLDAIAKTIAELDPEINRGLEEKHIDNTRRDLLFKVFIKDGSDGLGDVSIYKQASDRSLPNKAFRASFCIFKIDVAVDEGESVTIFEETEPNSIRTNRPILEAIADENDRSSSMICLLPIEKEREFVDQKILKVETDTVPRRCQIDFYTSMVDEKLAREKGGLMGAGSAYLCTLCTATRETAKSELGSFSITRTYEGIKVMAEYIEKNPDQLPEAKLTALAKGVKQMPVLKADALKIGIDATHADINMGRFFKNLLCREAAQVTCWALTQDIKYLVLNAEKKLDHHLKRSVGVNPALMMPGNYARQMFDEKNEEHFLHLVPDSRKEDMRMLFVKFRSMRHVYRARTPLETCPNEVANYKTVAVEFGKVLLDKFPYAEWPNYCHKIIEHTQELIQHKDGAGTVGGLSGEGNEGGNKVFRQFRRDLTSRAGAIESLTGVIKLHWLYSSPQLRAVASVIHRQNRCSVCAQLGHNARKHGSLAGQRADDDDDEEEEDDVHALLATP